MSNCYIICGYIDFNIRSLISFNNNDYVICADKGYEYANNENIHVDIIVGDLDSLNCLDKRIKRIILPHEKDYTDTFFCLKFAIKLGYKNIILIGGLGNRMDHTLANMQLLKYAYLNNTTLCIINEKNILTIAGNENILIRKQPYYISIFPFEKNGVISTEGLKYNLAKKQLRNSFPVGVSNEFNNDMARITFENGLFYLIISKD